MGDVQEYGDVVQEIRGALNPGRLKLQTGSVIFKNVKTGKVDQFQGGEVDKAQWLKRAKGYCLKFVLSSGTIHRYDGFKEAEFDKLAKFISNNYALSLEKVDMSLKGWNWGSAEFEANALNFKVDNNLAFEIPLNNVMNATSSKNEVTVEFHPNDDAAVSLIEVRFHISKKAGVMWKELSDKTEWEEKAKQAKAEYEVAMEEYRKNKPDTDSESEGDSKPKQKKSKSKPKSSPKKKSDAPAGRSAGGGSSFKSKEFLDSDDLSDMTEDSDDDKSKKSGSKASGSDREESEGAQSGSEKAGSASDKGSASEKEDSASGSD